MENTRVVKFGGSSFPDARAYLDVAEFIAKGVNDGDRFCVVVSAMSGTTGRLAELYEEIEETVCLEDRDSVLTNGEILAACLMKAALRQRGVESLSLNCLQLGWVATPDFTDGRLEDYSGKRILEALNKVPVVVIAGGQAVTRDGMPVMLGRNSSDLTCVACAAALDIKNCTIFSDVEGVYTSDPYEINGARLIPQLKYDYAEMYSKAGAKVLHHRCVTLARKHDIKISCAYLCRSSLTATVGTCIENKGQGVQIVQSSKYTLFEFNTTKDALDAIKYCSSVAGIAFQISDSPETIIVSTSDCDRLELNERWKKLDRNIIVIFAFDSNGRCQTFPSTPDKARAVAQGLHDELVHETGLPKVGRALSKTRNAHSKVFSPRTMDMAK